MLSVFTVCVNRLFEILSIQRHSYFLFTARSAAPWPPVNCAVSRNFFNSLLTPCFVQLFSGNSSSVNLFAVYPFKYKLYFKILSSSLIPCWLLTNTAVVSAVTNFRYHKLIVKVNKEKYSDMENFIWNQHGKRLTIWNTENIKICGEITKRRVKNAICFLCLQFLPHLQKIWIFNFPR